MQSLRQYRKWIADCEKMAALLLPLVPDIETWLQGYDTLRRLMVFGLSHTETEDLASYQSLALELFAVKFRQLADGHPWQTLLCYWVQHCSSALQGDIVAEDWIEGPDMQGLPPLLEVAARMLRGASVESADPLDDWSLQTRAAAARPAGTIAGIPAIVTAGTLAPIAGLSANSGNIFADVDVDADVDMPAGEAAAGGTKRTRAMLEDEDEVVIVENEPGDVASANKRRRSEGETDADGTESAAEVIPPMCSICRSEVLDEEEVSSQMLRSKLRTYLARLRRTVVDLNDIGIGPKAGTCPPQGLSEQAAIILNTLTAAATALIDFCDHKDTKETFDLLDAKGPKYWVDELPQA